MELKIEIKCICGNCETVKIKKGKEFKKYDSLTEELAIQDSISEFGNFKAYQMSPESFYILCSACKEEVEVF